MLPSSFDLDQAARDLFTSQLNTAIAADKDVVVVAPKARSIGGRRKIVLLLRRYGVAPGVTAKLGWATVMPDPPKEHRTPTTPAMPVSHVVEHQPDSAPAFGLGDDTGGDSEDSDQ